MTFGLAAFFEKLVARAYVYENVHLARVLLVRRSGLVFASPGGVMAVGRRQISSSKPSSSRRYAFLSGWRNHTGVAKAAVFCFCAKPRNPWYVAIMSGGDELIKMKENVKSSPRHRNAAVEMKATTAAHAVGIRPGDSTAAWKRRGAAASAG